MIRWIAILLLCALAGCGAPGETDASDAGPSDAANSEGSLDGSACSAGPGEVFERRIEPLLSPDRPASCTKCHAPGVDLAAFVRSDPCSTMACLVESDLVDLDEPRSSKLLEFIERGHAPREGSGVTEEMVAAEYEGFLAWIEWSARCGQAACGDSTSACGSGPRTPLRDAGTDMPPSEPPPLTLENYSCSGEDQARAFRDHAFPSHGRCGHCHAVDGAIAGVAGAPTWIAADPTVEGARETITNLYALRAIDLENPRKSRVLLKPLREDQGGIDHGGGGKFAHRQDPLYIALLAWMRLQKQCLPGTPDPGPYDDRDKD